MSAPTAAQLQTFVYDTFSSYVGLKPDAILGDNYTLSDIVVRSEKLQNSLDLMESFAKTSNAVHRQYGIRVRLPAFPMTTPVSQVVDAFLEQTAKVEEQPHAE